MSKIAPWNRAATGPSRQFWLPANGCSRFSAHRSQHGRVSAFTVGPVTRDLVSLPVTPEIWVASANVLVRSFIQGSGETEPAASEGGCLLLRFPRAAGNRCGVVESALPGTLRL